MAGTPTPLAIPSGTDSPGRSLPAMSVRLWWCGAALLAVVSLTLAWPKSSTASIVPAAVPAPSAPLASSTSFGVVDAIRELAAADAAGPRRFEMTVRMRDGSILVTQETGGARWRVGEAFQLTGYTVATQP